MKRKSLADLNAMVAPAGGECDPAIFASKYRDTWSKIVWRCRAGHQFSASYQVARSRLGLPVWCPECAKKARPEMLENEVRPKLEVAIRARGGMLLSALGYKRKSSIRVSCPRHGEFVSTVERILKNAWCRRCHIEEMVSKREYHRRLDLSFFVERAQKANCTLLSKEYTGAAQALEFFCNRHRVRFAVRASHAAQGHFCRKCGRERAAAKMRMSIEDIREFVPSNYAGVCLSPVYSDHRKKLRWRCALGHEWEACLRNIVTCKEWCPECNKDRRRGERICRAFFEQVFNAPFKCARLAWLKGRKGRLMELDGYCEELGIAFEHHGLQHYAVTSFTPDADSLRYRQALDQIKRELCAKRGVKLFEIPALIEVLPLDQLKDEFAKQAQALGVPLRQDFADLAIDFRAAYAVQRRPSRKRNTVQAKRGKLIQPSLPLS